MPIILLDNEDRLAGGKRRPDGHPFHLLEGHRRLGYLRAVYGKDPDTLRQKHGVWVVEVSRPDEDP